MPMFRGVFTHPVTGGKVCGKKRRCAEGWPNGIERGEREEREERERGERERRDRER